jgi:glycosyltransferase involved in cell wall biosynthesis
MIHWNFYHPLNPYVWCLTALRPRIRHYLTDHNSRYPSEPESRSRVRGMLKSALFRRYERIFCVSDYVRNSLGREGVSLGLSRCTHFVNTSRFQPDAAAGALVRSELMAESQFVLLVVAHLIREKGVDVVLRALAELPAHVTAWVVGDGLDAARLRRVAEDLGIARRVRFLGNRSDVQTYMQAADCLVCPSVWEEAAGLVNIESLACGLPVVASRIGGIPEIVDDGRTGFLFSPGSAAELARTIRRLIREPDLTRRMGKAAREFAMERYSAEQRIEEFIEFYRKPVARGGPTAE